MAGLSMFGVWLSFLSAIGLGVFVSLRLSAIVLKPVASMYLRSAASCRQPIRWYGLSQQTHTSG